MHTQYSFTCAHCKQPFTTDRRKQTYCSKGCATAAHWSSRSVDVAYWPRIDRRGGAETCWLWQAGCDRDGYGKCRVHGFTERRAHRIAYMLAHGPIPDDLWVLHTCDTPRCCNPAHLFLGTVADNNADMIAKGRDARGERSGARKHPERVNRGEQCHSAKLTEDQVQESLGKACLQLEQDYIQWFIHEKRVGHCIGPHVVDHFDPSTFYHFGA